MHTQPRPAAWIDDDTAGALLPALWQRFGRRAAILPTAALTGRHLLSLTRDMSEYPPLPDDLQRLIRRTSGQGRVEVTTLPEIEEIPNFLVCDMRFAYAASCQNLPCGHVGVLDYRGGVGGHHFDRYQRGRFHIEFQVPAGWDHLGIFGVQADDGMTWHYPARPGERGETWAGNAELALAEDMGWRFVIREAIVFGGPHAGLPGPLDAWIAKLLQIRRDALLGGERSRISLGISRAVRAIVLHTIGALHSAGRSQLVRVPEADAHMLPRDNPTVRRLRDGSVSYRQFVGMPAHLQAYMHPEWSAEIWSRCRARLLRFNRMRARQVTDTWGALTIPRAQILGFRTDALYLQADPMFPDYNELGNFRIKGVASGPFPAPRTIRALNDLRKAAGDGAE